VLGGRIRSSVEEDKRFDARAKRDIGRIEVCHILCLRGSSSF